MLGGPCSQFAIACARDHIRRPAFLVSAGLVGVLLALLPRVGNPAAGVADNARLAGELTLSSLQLAAVIWCGIQAVQSARGSGEQVGSLV